MRGPRLMNARSLWILMSCVAAGLLAAAWLRPRPAATPGGVGPSSPSARAPVGAWDAESAPARTAGVVHASIRGTVTDVRGDPIAGPTAHIEVVGPGGLRVAALAEDGTFEFRGVEPGSWTVACRSSGHIPSSVDLWIDGERAESRADFVLLASRALRVRLSDAQGAALAPRLAAEGLDPRHVGRIELEQEGCALRVEPARAFFSAEGRALEIVEATPARLRLLVGDVLLDEAWVAPDAQDVVLRADVDRVRSQAAWITLEVPESHASRTEVVLASVAEPCWRIRFEAEQRAPRIAVAPDAYVLEIAPLGSASLRFERVVAPGAEVALGRIPLERELLLRGRVLSSAGRPLPAPLDVRPVGQAGPHAYTRQARADANGRFLVRGLSSGAWEVVCSWGLALERVELPTDREVELRAELPVSISERAGSARPIR